jgi:hypothetical protein
VFAIPRANYQASDVFPDEMALTLVYQALLYKIVRLPTLLWEWSVWLELQRMVVIHRLREPY